MRSQGITAILLTVQLGGCASTTATHAAKDTSTPILSTTTTPTPTPTVSVATENEVASIIAGSEETWREANDKTGDCRLAHVIKDDSAVSEAELMTCHTNEITAGLKAQTAIRDLGALDIPLSMQSLVDETTSALQMMADADLEKACGSAMRVPNDSKACTQSLGTRMVSDHLVSGVLDKWKPYL